MYNLADSKNDQVPSFYNEYAIDPLLDLIPYVLQLHAKRSVCIKAYTRSRIGIILQNSNEEVKIYLKVLMKDNKLQISDSMVASEIEDEHKDQHRIS